MIFDFIFFQIGLSSKNKVVKQNNSVLKPAWIDKPALIILIDTQQPAALSRPVITVAGFAVLWFNIPLLCFWWFLSLSCAELVYPSG